MDHYRLKTSFAKLFGIVLCLGLGATHAYSESNKKMDDPRMDSGAPDSPEGVQAEASSVSADAMGKPGDAEIAEILMTADQIDIENGKMASSKTKSDEVREFARHMVSDHTASKEKGAALARQMNLDPRENALSRSLEQRGRQMKGELSGLKGADFDRAYVDREVEFHQSLLTTIDQTLIPSARSRELKSHIQSVRPVIASHLNHAKQLQSQLGKTAGESEDKRSENDRTESGRR